MVEDAGGLPVEDASTVIDSTPTDFGANDGPATVFLDRVAFNWSRREKPGHHGIAD